jgi:hypothetical protein
MEVRSLVEKRASWRTGSLRAVLKKWPQDRPGVLGKTVKKKRGCNENIGLMRSHEEEALKYAQM